MEHVFLILLQIDQTTNLWGDIGESSFWKDVRTGDFSSSEEKSPKVGSLKFSNKNLRIRGKNSPHRSFYAVAYG